MSGTQGGRQRRGIERAELSLGFVETSDQQKAPDVEIAAIGRIHMVAVGVEREPRGVERLGGPVQIARDEGDLGLGDDAPRTRHGFLRTEGARGPFHELLRACEIAELRHCDAA